MNKRQFELAKTAILADANHQGEFFGPEKGQSCAVGGLYLAADPGWDWEYYQALSEDAVQEIVEEVYGLDWTEQDEIINTNDNTESGERRVAVIEILEKILVQSSDQAE